MTDKPDFEIFEKLVVIIEITNLEYGGSAAWKQSER